MDTPKIMNKITTIIWTLILLTEAQHIDVQDLTNNNGYIPIKMEELKTISHYDKTLHFINLTAYDETMQLIANNIATLQGSTLEDKQLLDTIGKSFRLLQAKISSLHPNSRSRRGLINIIGSGLKYVAGTMDNEDEKQIKDALDSLGNMEKSTTVSINKLIYTNNFMSDQINNITRHINGQQTRITGYLNEFREMTQNRIKTIEDEVKFIEHIYQMDKDISLLRDHINDIGQIVFSSKLGIIPTDILTRVELDLITDLNSYRNIKIAVILQNDTLVITLLIPQYSPNVLSRIRFEPIPNANNNSLALDDYETYVDSKNTIYKTDIENNLEKNLITIKNKCLQDILEFREAVCEMKKETQLA